MTAGERWLIILVLGLAILCGGTYSGTVAGNHQRGDHDGVREVVRDEVDRYLQHHLPSLVDAELRRQEPAGADTRPIVDVSARDQLPEMNLSRVDELMSMTRTIRSQLALYSLQHRDRMPTLAQLNDGWRVLISCTDQDGNIVARDPATFGPYLASPPVNPLNGSAKVAPHGGATPQHGWSFDQATGRFFAVVPHEMQSAFAHRRDVEPVSGIELADISK